VGVKQCCVIDEAESIHVITRIWKHRRNTAPANGDQSLYFMFADRRFWLDIRYQNLETMI
jgi:hypothetical protein